MRLAYRLLVTALVLGLPSSAAGQVRTLLGRAVDSVTARAVTGGTVTVMGTNQATGLREDGSFAVTIPLREVTLSVTANGYLPREVRVPYSDNEAMLMIPLARDLFGQGRETFSGHATGVERRNAANNVGEVSAEDLSRGSTRQVDQALKAKVPGADVSVSTNPGGAMAIRLRGLTTLLGSTTPLYVVDGVIVYSIDSINPNDIEDIQLLKGASAGAMYGSRGSNGVILIKTKRGGLSGRARQ